MQSAPQYNKDCSRCHSTKLISQFHVLKTTADGRNPWCKECRNADMLRYYNERGGRSVRVARNDKSYTSTAEAQWSWLQRWAAKRGLDMTITQHEYLDLISKPCSYCDLPIKHRGARLDRLDNMLGYTLTNVVPCCKICNQARSNIFSPEEMKRLGVVIRQILQARS